MRFGIFMAPFHAVEANPTSALERDLELLQHLDRLGFDEAWVGEHHSAGTEIVADPMLFCATAFERTRNIRLGSGVVSLPYHNPLWVADKAIQLSHISRGRFMLGLGPGSLSFDANMIGIEPERQRPLLDEGMDVLMHLLRSEDPISFENDRWCLRGAKTQLRPYKDIDVAVAAIASPSGPSLAGKHGVGLLSIGATMVQGADVLGAHWNVLEERAAHFGHTPDRDAWRLVGLMHIAETREQAMREVEYGIEEWFDYCQNTYAGPQFQPQGDTLRERIEWVMESGIGAIGTPRDAIDQLNRLDKQSNGGFGAYLLMHTEWANPQATSRSYELLADRVISQFQGQAERRRDSKMRARARHDEFYAKQAAAIASAGDRYKEAAAGSAR
jgi:alkanesulfonate monooxygenase SsuD/methylene tetrahydromethanopterin reductase-like flavin-dependent oxidoreductase (luciferase family)